MRIRLQVLGGFMVGAGPRAQVTLAKPYQALLGYVLVHRNRIVLRDELAGRIWSESDNAHARRCLSTAVWRLRKVFEGAPALLTRQGDGFAFNWKAPAWVDVVAMETRLSPYRRSRPETLKLADIRRIEQGVRLYRGDFLAGLDDEWALIERQRLRNLYLDALYGLTLGYASLRDWPGAITAGRQLALAEPLREDVHRLLMRAYLATGNRAKSVAQFRLCEQALRDEIGVAPMAETLNLHREIVGLGEPTAVQHLLQPAAVEEAQRRAHRVKRILGLAEKHLDCMITSLESAGAQDPRPH
jgi:DNA-binding SARP family transcriptional activator